MSESLEIAAEAEHAEIVRRLKHAEQRLEQLYADHASMRAERDQLQRELALSQRANASLASKVQAGREREQRMEVEIADMQRQCGQRLPIPGGNRVVYGKDSYTLAYIEQLSRARSTGAAWSDTTVHDLATHLRDTLAELERASVQHLADVMAAGRAVKWAQAWKAAAKHYRGEHLESEMLLADAEKSEAELERRLADAEGEGCTLHGDAPHGKEADELRAGIERLIIDLEASYVYSGTQAAFKASRELQTLLDRVQARDSLAHLRANDELVEAKKRIANLEQSVASQNEALIRWGYVAAALGADTVTDRDPERCLQAVRDIHASAIAAGAALEGQRREAAAYRADRDVWQQRAGEYGRAGEAYAWLTTKLWMMLSTTAQEQWGARIQELILHADAMVKPRVLPATGGDPDGLGTSASMGCADAVKVAP